MQHTLITIGGVITIYSFGAMIALGIMVFSWLVKKDTAYHQMNLDTIWDTMLTGGIVGGLIGGRLVYYLCDDDIYNIRHLFYFWQGGYSVLGAILGIMLTLYLLLTIYHIPIMPFFDLHMTYAPFLQGIARIGCFLSGCCHGCPTEQWWGITYSDQASFAPLNIPIHPTQLYSATLLISIGLYTYINRKKLRKIPGQTIILYLTLISIERFIIDFLRDDRIIISTIKIRHYIIMISLYQYIALLIFLVAMTIKWYSNFYKKTVS